LKPQRNPAATAGIVKLPYDHARYFELDADTQVVALDRLSPTKPMPQHAPSVARARLRMEEAASGERPRRAPLRVRAENGRLLIVDGNATYGVAQMAGWPDVPVSID